MKSARFFMTALLAMALLPLSLTAQPGEQGKKIEARDSRWILPADASSPSVWGIRGGIVVGLWPYGIETAREAWGGGPRGLLRIGIEKNRAVYMINFIAVEPIVNGQIEFSEISNSVVDNRWGKLMWAGATDQPGSFSPNAITQGNITHPDPENPDVEELSFYVFMEKFKHGAHPYLKIMIRNDRPYEIGFKVFHREGSAPMDRCTLTATMGNYGRLRLLYLKDRIVDSRVLYKDFDELQFVEKEGIPYDQMLKDKNGDWIAVCTANETLPELADWPQRADYQRRFFWRWRPPFKLTQYWRKPKDNVDPSLHIRLNGRKYYWAAWSARREDYMALPGGVSFENFEFREKYHPGQEFYFGLTPKTPQEMELNLPY